MANKIVNRVKMTVTGTPGTGTITLGSAVSGFQSMAGAGVVDADTVPYVIEDGSAWELGVGTITVSGSTYTMSRSVTASSNSGSPISASSSALVFITPLAADLQSGTSANNLVRLDGSAKLPTVDGSALTNLNASNIASGTVPASLLPNPTSTTLGGVKSKASITNYFLTQIGTDGSVSSAQPAFTDISGTLSVANGGTGLTSLTANRIPYASATDTLGTSSNLLFDGSKLTISAGGSAVSAKIGYDNGVADSGIYYSADGSLDVRSRTSYPLLLSALGSTYAAFSTNGSERLRIASDGSVGIGTTSPLGKLHVFKSSGAQLQLQCDNTGLVEINMGGTTTPAKGGISFSDNADVLLFRTGSTERLRLDASGNLGLGVTPSAWTGGRAVDLGLSGAVFGDGYVYNWTAGISQNAYRLSDSSYKYKATQPAAVLELTNNTFNFKIAPSGTAGSAISFTQALTLTAAANLLLGGTSDPGGANSLYIANTGSVPGTPSGGGVLYVQSGALKYKGSSGTITTLGAA